MNQKIKKIIKSEQFKSLLAAIICAFIGLFVGYLVLLIINPKHAFKAIITIIQSFFFFKSPNQQLYYFGSTLVKAVPVILCGLSVTFAYKAGLFNIGVAGQYCIGIGATLWCALVWNMPWYVCIFFAMIVSALWACIVGFLKAFFYLNEVIACIMLNWISVYIVNAAMSDSRILDWLTSRSYLIADKNPSALIPKCGLNYLFHNNQYVTIALIFTIIIAVVVLVILNKTTFGYEIKATGLNKNAAKYAGMKEKILVVLTMAISGAIVGCAASFYYLTDIVNWITCSSVPELGFNGIAVAFLGGLNPIGVIFAGYFIEHISFGGSCIDMRYFPPQIADLIISIIIYLCAFVLFIKYIINKVADKKSHSEE